MIYIIDNGEHASDYTLYFVEAPPDFGDWWKSTFDPWQCTRAGRYVLLGVATSVEWEDGRKAMPVALFLSGSPAGQPQYPGIARGAPT